MQVTTLSALAGDLLKHCLPGKEAQDILRCKAAYALDMFIKNEQYPLKNVGLITFEVPRQGPEDPLVTKITVDPSNIRTFRQLIRYDLAGQDVQPPILGLKLGLGRYSTALRIRDTGQLIVLLQQQNLPVPSYIASLLKTTFFHDQPAVAVELAAEVWKRVLDVTVAENLGEEQQQQLAS